jgi:hypothetical protein
VGVVLLAKKLALAVKLVRQALKEQQTEDEFLELRGILLAPRRMSADLKRKLSSWESVIFSRVMVSFCAMVVDPWPFSVPDQ